MFIARTATQVSDVAHGPLVNSRNYLQGNLLEQLTQDNMIKVMNIMAAEKGPFKLKSHLDNIVFYQVYTLCFGEK